MHKMMMKIKASKKASFFLSLSCILMSLTVLIGTSFAWFTDTATSTNNRIKTGTLKVGLDYRTVTLGQAASDWKDANNAEDILNKDNLYEPGYVSLTFFRVKNLGSLSLKYQFALIKTAEQAGVNILGNSFKLSDNLSFNFVALNDTTAITKNQALTAGSFTREDALALVANNENKLGFDPQYTIEAVMPSADPEAEENVDVIALVITMPSTVGNVTNYDSNYTAPSLTLDFKLVATQYSSEKDSFDEYYDKKAYNDDWNVYQFIRGDIANGLSAYDVDGDESNRYEVVTVTGTQSKKVDLSVSECNTPVNIQVVAGTMYVSYDLVVTDETGNKYDDTFSIKMFVGKDLTKDKLKLYHNGILSTEPNSGIIDGGDFAYDADGYITFRTSSLSPFTVAVEGVAAMIKGDERNEYYNSLNDAVNTVNTGAKPDGSVIYVVAKSNVVEDPVILNSGKTVTIDLNGCTTKTTVNKAIQNKGTLYIKDSSKNGKGIVSNGGEIEFVADLEEGVSIIENKGFMYFDSGKIEASVNNLSKKTFNVITCNNGSTLNFNGGEICANYIKPNENTNTGINGIYSSGDASNSPVINFTGGKVYVYADSGHVNGINAISATVKITGGEIVVISARGNSNGVAISNSDKDGYFSDCHVKAIADGAGSTAKGFSFANTYTGNVVMKNINVHVDSLGVDVGHSGGRGINFNGTGSFRLIDDPDSTNDRNIIQSSCKSGSVGIAIDTNSQNVLLENFDITVSSESGTARGIMANKLCKVVINGSDANKNSVNMTTTNTSVYAISSADSSTVDVSNTSFTVTTNSNPVVFGTSQEGVINVNSGNTINATKTNNGNVVVCSGTGVNFISGSAPPTQKGNVTWSN